MRSARRALHSTFIKIVRQVPLRLLFMSFLLLASSCNKFRAFLCKEKLMIKFTFLLNLKFTKDARAFVFERKKDIILLKTVERHAV